VNIFKRNQKPRTLAFHEIHELWLRLSVYRGNTTLEVCKELREAEDEFARACKVVYGGSNVDTGYPSLDALLLSKGLEKVGYPEYKEAINGN
jgi:hypothetical protein